MKRSRDLEEDSSHCSDQEVIAALYPVSKAVQLDSELLDPKGGSCPVSNMICCLPPHKDPVSFRSFHDYEAHYARDHSYRCYECHRNLPSEHLLDVHIEECHDAFTAVKRERGEKTVKSCERKCSTPQKRRMHLIDKHLYPKNFFFAVTRDGIDGRNSLLHEGSYYRRRSSPGPAIATATTSSANHIHIAETPTLNQPAISSSSRNKPQDRLQAAASSSTKSNDGSTSDTIYQSAPTTPDTEMEDLADAMSGLKFVPRNIRFGRGCRAGFSRA
ncbi:hypothetical protein Cpir12675_003307 [Ceratocystis pirilliformis]|uniref:C2H2-type domain-containing protein n=1 Tax=Ceratocystis pirilliformis TaxID=259994 RepID=A0ABR3Z5F2_9PEZI